MKYDIFISYRRKGGYETAKHLYDLLVRDGYTVSFDIDTLRNGDFDVALLKRIEECKDVILVLNEGAFDRTLDPSFDPRQDWLRNELAHALKHDKNIIPIMLAGFNEFPVNLPADIARVQRKNGPKYDQYYFDEFYARLCNIFLESKPVAKPQPQAAKTAEYELTLKSDETSMIVVNGEEFGKVKGGKSRVLSLKPGKSYEIELRSLATKEEPIKVTHKVPLDKASAILDLSFARRREEIKKQREEEKKELEKFREEQFLQCQKQQQCLELYDDYDYEDCDMVAVKSNELWGFVNEDGFEVIRCEYKEYVAFSEDYVFVQRKDNRWLCFDKNGFEMVELWSEEPSFVYGGLCVVTRGGKQRMMAVDGRATANLWFDAIKRTEKPEVIAAKVYNNFFFADALSGKQLDRMTFDNVRGYSKSILRSSAPFRYSISKDHNGAMCFPLEVIRDGLTGYVNNDLKQTVPCVAESEMEMYSDNGLKILKIKGKFALVNVEAGKFITPPIYDFMAENWVEDKLYFCVGFGCSADPSNNGRGGGVYYTYGGRQGIIDDSGNVIVPLEYHFTIAHYEQGQLCASKLSNEGRGKWVKDRWSSNRDSYSFEPDERPVNVETFYYDDLGRVVRTTKDVWWNYKY